MTVPARVTLVTICARDMPRMAAFYQSLGWEDLLPDTPDYFQFRTAGAIVSLWKMDEALAELHLDRAVEPGAFSGISLAANVHTREEVDTAIEAARAAGASRIIEATDRDWGGRSGHFFDPEGNAWEIAWNPGIPLDELGRAAVTP